MRQNHKATTFAAPTLALALAGGILAAPTPARADDTIKHPGDHPAYTFEVEPHLLLGWDNVYGGNGWGGGVRFGIPIVDNGFVDSINNSVAISFGVDLLHYDRCWHAGSCVGNYIDFPVAMQWNFYVGKRWSVFGEPGLVLYHGFFEDCPNGVVCPGAPVATSLEPALFLGGRYYLSDRTTLTMRIGFPSFSFGVSFFP
jgi:hypothetical protein